MKAPHVLAAAGALALLACRAPAPASASFKADDPAVVAAIDSIMRAAEEGSAKVDANAVTRMAEGPLEFTFITGDVMLSGLAPVRNAFQDTYSKIEKQSHTIERQAVRLVSPDVAIFTAIGEGTYTDHAGWTSPPVGIGLTVVFVRQDGRWQAVHAHQSIAP